MQHSETTPSAPPNRQDPRSLIRQRQEQAARKDGDNNTLWKTTSSACWSLETRFSLTQKPGDDFVPDLHDLWFIYYHGSKNISADSPAQDRLALQVIQIQGKGALSRCAAPGGAIEMATTSDGIIWTDLPFFVPDMMDFWTKDCAGMSAAHRVNFSHFLAQLASTGLAKDKLCGIALILFRDALETLRSPGEIDANGGEDATRSMADLTIGDLLPAVHTWLLQAGTKIIQLSDNGWQDCPDGARAIGTLYHDDASTSMKSAGFSPERWIFWLRRLEEITHDAKFVGMKNLAEFTTKVMDVMLLKLNQSYSVVRGEFEASPGVVQYRNAAYENFVSTM